ncbi:hypothetical protein BJF79_02290 [Actinomadura sp. CNU-125]|nr:hypothetical protein BJF79_02290 [Actinomadura sp. CNU-125]
MPATARSQALVGEQVGGVVVRAGDGERDVAVPAAHDDPPAGLEAVGLHHGGGQADLTGRERREAAAQLQHLGEGVLVGPRDGQVQGAGLLVGGAGARRRRHQPDVGRGEGGRPCHAGDGGDSPGEVAGQRA